jgi:hypothetical protein
MAYRNIEGGRSPNTSGTFLNREPIESEVQRDTFDEDMRLYKTLMVRALIRKYGEIRENVLQNIEVNIDNTINNAKNLIIQSQAEIIRRDRQENEEGPRGNTELRRTTRENEEGPRGNTELRRTTRENEEEPRGNTEEEDEDAELNINIFQNVFTNIIRNVLNQRENETEIEKRNRQNLLLTDLHAGFFTLNQWTVFIKDIQSGLYRGIYRDIPISTLEIIWRNLPDDIIDYYNNMANEMNEIIRIRAREEQNEDTEEEEEFNREDIGRYINIVRQILNERQNETERQKRDREERLLTNLPSEFFTYSQWRLFLKDIEYELSNRTGIRISTEAIATIWTNLPNEIKNYYNTMADRLNRIIRRRR